MMTHQLEVSILAAPLAAIDRRTLSQAWYSALHLARPDRLSERPRECSTCIAEPPRPGAEEEETEPLSSRRAQTRLQHCAQSRSLMVTAQPNAARISLDRAARPLSERIERRFAHAPSQITRATFSMGRGAARVHVILQTNGNTATLVALCRPQMQSIVARALAQARLTLATRGFVLDLETRGERCS